jgi:hypothetical protein
MVTQQKELCAASKREFQYFLNLGHHQQMPKVNLPKNERFSLTLMPGNTINQSILLRREKILREGGAYLMHSKNFVLILSVVCFLCISLSSGFAGSSPVFSEYVTGGTFDNTWALLTGEGTLSAANSDSAYPAGQVFPNPSGDGWVMKVQSPLGQVGTEGGVSGDELWTDMLVSAQMFINVSTAARHDTMLGGRMTVATPEWGTGGRGGYFTTDPWGLTPPPPCWGIRNNYDSPQPTFGQVYSNNGWHQIILVIAGTNIDLYVDMTYAQVVAAMNAGTPLPLLSYSPLTGTNGGVGFYVCYRTDASSTGEPGYIDDIEVYLPPYSTPTPTPTPLVGAAVTSTWAVYE